MAKHKLDLKVTKNLLFPYLPVLVGVNVGGKPNYIAIGLIGWLCYDMMSISVGHKQYSKIGIDENGTFSINQPTADLVRELDFCGMKSGRNTDKAALFETFYGELETAPMIRECPVNIECRVVQTLNRSIHSVFLGEVVAVHASEEYLAEGLPDVTRIDPIFYAPDANLGKGAHGYWRLGERIGRAFDIGKDLKTN
ncbi:flavin reductase family protein [Candidatus Bipolaricaulota bacterium]